jgi:hypothetical protein
MRDHFSIKRPTRDGRCYVDVMFARRTPDGYRSMPPPIPVALDTFQTGIVLPKSIADALELQVEARKPGSEYPALTTVVYQVYDDRGDLAWIGEGKAMVDPEVEHASLGMFQLQQWQFFLDGPAGGFELHLPRPSAVIPKFGPMLEFLRDGTVMARTSELRDGVEYRLEAVRLGQDWYGAWYCTVCRDGGSRSTVYGKDVKNAFDEARGKLHPHHCIVHLKQGPGDPNNNRD